MLKGDAKTAYMREYMRKRRKAAAKPGAKAEEEPKAKLDEVHAELAKAKLRIQHLEQELAKAKAKPAPPLDDAEKARLAKLEYDYEVRVCKLENEYIAKLERQARDMRPVQISGDVQTQVNQWLELLLPELHKERSKARQAVAKRKRILSKAAFSKLLFAVHSDTGRHATATQRDTATRILNALKPYVLAEADEPTQWDSDLPNDLAGWAKRLHDAELKRRMRTIPQPKGMPLPSFLDPKQRKR
jgi:hypothetical protein